MEGKKEVLSVAMFGSLEKVVESVMRARGSSWGGLIVSN